jgi:hypothetical protein
MAVRVFPTNTSCSESVSKSPNVTPVEPARVGHVFKVYADYAVFDVNTGDFVAPELVVNERGSRGLIQAGTR